MSSLFSHLSFSFHPPHLMLLGMTPRIIEKPAFKLQTSFSRKPWEKKKRCREIERRLKKKSEEDRGRLFWEGSWAAHWYDSLIFWPLMWSGLGGHPSIITPVTSSLFSSHNLHTWFKVAACVARSIYFFIFYSPLSLSLCVHQSWADAPWSVQSRITCGGMWSWSSCRPGNTSSQVWNSPTSTPRNPSWGQGSWRECVSAHVCEF